MYENVSILGIEASCLVGRNIFGKLSVNWASTGCGKVGALWRNDEVEGGIIQTHAPRGPRPLRVSHLSPDAIEG